MQILWQIPTYVSSQKRKKKHFQMFVRSQTYFSRCRSYIGEENYGGCGYVQEMQNKLSMTKSLKYDSHSIQKKTIF